MLPATLEDTLSEPEVTAPTGIGCVDAEEEEEVRAEAAPDEIIWDLLHPARATDAEKAARPLRS